jgi:hypothetical protein
VAVLRWVGDVSIDSNAWNVAPMALAAIAVAVRVRADAVRVSFMLCLHVTFESPPMQHRRSALATLAVACSFALPCAAQTIQPGLWEVSNVVASGNPEIDRAMAAVQQHMAGMSSEQRQQLDAMMGRQGISLNAGSGGLAGVSAKLCVSAQMAAHNEMPMSLPGDCSVQRAPLVNNSMKVSFSCTRPNAVGDGEVVFSGPRAYRVKMRVTSNARGKADTVNVDANGKWLSADCGSIAPPSR